MSNVKKKKTSCICINIRRAANELTNYYDKIMEPLNITITQFSIMSSLKTLGNCSVSDLAQHMGLERTTMVRTIKPLFKKGLVEDVSEEGRRSRSLQLTQKGIDAYQKGRPLWEEAQAHVSEILGDDNIKAIYNIADHFNNEIL